MAKVHVAANQSPASPWAVLVMADSPTTAAPKGIMTMSPCMGRTRARITAGAAARTTFHHGMANQKTRISENATAKAAVTSHLFCQIVVHVPGTGALVRISSEATVISLP